MSTIFYVSVLSIIYISIIQLPTIECRPSVQKLVIHGHEWTVPNEPGWENVLYEAEPVRHRLLSNCNTSHECRLALDELRRIFLKHSVSSKYYDNSQYNDRSKFDQGSIFKWG